MSMSSTYCIIAGYDLTGFDTDKFKDWIWDKEGEKYICYQRKGKVQLFTDPEQGKHLYLGYILALGDAYEFEPAFIDISNLESLRGKVDSVLLHLQETGVIIKDSHFHPEFRIIAFEEYS